MALREGIERRAGLGVLRRPRRRSSCDDVVVIGALVADNLRVDAPAGRGARLRRAHGRAALGLRSRAAGLRRGRARPSAYTRGTANVWSILSADPERDLVFVPTGNAAPDYYGGERHGLDYYVAAPSSRSTRDGRARLALPDRAPRPLGLRRARRSRRCSSSTRRRRPRARRRADHQDGPPLPARSRDAARRSTRSRSGRCRRAASRARPLSPTQPFPTHPPPLHPQALAPDDAFGFTPWDRGKCREMIAQPALRRHLHAALARGLDPVPEQRRRAELGRRLDRPAARACCSSTRCAMRERRAAHAARRVRRAPEQAAPYPDELVPDGGHAVRAARCGRCSSPLGAPCNPPPWGVLHGGRPGDGQARSGSRRSARRATRRRSRCGSPLGAPNLGGSLATAGGLVFIGATTDKFLRAFDAETGAEIWRTRLPYTANATPMTYRLRTGRPPVRRRRRGRPRLVRARRRADGLRAAERGRSQLINELPFGDLTGTRHHGALHRRERRRAAHPHRPRGRARHRQPGRDRDPDGQAPAGGARPRPAHRPAGGDGHAHRAAPDALVGHRPLGAALRDRRPRVLRPRPDPPRRRPLLDRQGHPRDPHQARGARGAPAGRAARAAPR